MTDFSPLAVPIQMHQMRVAVLVDGDNFPHAELARLEAEAARFGEVVIRRVFGDVKRVGGWPEAVGYQMLHCDNSTGRKNLADMHLTVAAMDMAQRGLAQGFVIASSDRDFEPVSQFLIESGRRVLRVRRTGQSAESAPPKPKKLSAVDQALMTLLMAHPEGVPLVTVGAQLRDGTVKAQTGMKTWRAYFTAHPERYALAGKGQAGTVRLKRP